MMRVLTTLIFVLFANQLFAQELKFSPLKSPVQDEANILSQSFVSNYSNTLKRIYSDGGPQIQVVTVTSLQGYPIEEFTIRLAEKWQIGRKEKNDGVILVIAPNERKVRIEVGADLEGDLTDYDSSVIIQKQIIPNFKTGDFETGIGLAINSILKELELSDYQKEQKYVTVQSHVKQKQAFSLLPFLLMFILYPILKLILKKPIFTGLASGGVMAVGHYILMGTALAGLGVLLVMFVLGFLFGILGPLNTAMIFMRGSGRGGGGGGGWSGGGGGFSGGGSSGSW